MRRTLAFVLLVAVGMGALYLATGGEGFTGSAASRQATPPRMTVDDGAGVTIRPPDADESDLSQAVSVKVGGRMSIPRSRTVRIGNRTRELRVYLLECQDSAPIADDRLRMIGVTVQFFDVRGPADDPVAVPTARLTADEALVQLGVDEQGRTSVEENKDMRVQGAVLETTSVARVPNLTLELGEAIATASDRGIRMSTAEATQPFRLEARGETPLSISGNGLQAWIPGTDALPGDPIRVDVTGNPVLVQSTEDGETRISARGPLSYLEDPDDGRASIVMEEEVRISMSDATGAGFQDDVSARGQRLRALLFRAEGRQAGEDETVWQGIWLTGTPVELSGRGAELACRELEIAPGPDGQPYMFSASGEPAVLIHRDDSGVVTRSTAERRIHLVRPGNHLAPVFAAFGFPESTLGPLLNHELVLIEGAAVVERGDDLSLQASEGLWLLRSNDGNAADPLLALQAHGEVELFQRLDDQDVRLHSNLGIAMSRTGDVRRIRLGPTGVSGDHVWSFSRDDLQLQGIGAAAIDVAAETFAMVLRAPGPQISATLSGDYGSLQLSDIVELDASIAGDQIEAFLARGPVCRIDAGAGGELQATAQVIESLDRDSLRLAGTVTAPARAHYRPGQGDGDPSGVRATDVRVAGPEIRVHRLSRDHVAIETEAPAPSVTRVQLEIQQDGGTTARVDLHARSTRFLPFAVHPAAFPLYALPPAARWLFGHGMRSPHVIARGQVTILQEEPLLSQRASGDFLLLGLGTEGGYLTGDPARLERRDAGGQRLQGIASRVELQRQGEGELLGLVATRDRLPELELIDPSGELDRTRGEPSRMHVVCDGDIKVFPDAVRFLGSVVMRNVRLDGSEDPEALQLTADRVTMVRHPETGEILEVQATGDVQLRWSKVTARGHLLTLDPIGKWITVSDPERNASVSLPNGLLYTAAVVRANYETLRVTIWYGRVEGVGRQR